MKNDNYSNILKTFINLIGFLKVITNFDSYSKDKKEFNNILETITNWMVKYEKERNLLFIDISVLENIYEKLDNFQTYYVCNNLLGSESEFSDFVLNWMQHLVIITKKEIEGEGRYNA